MLTPTRCVAKYLQTLWVLVVVLVNSGGSLSAQEGDADELSPNSVLTDAQWDQLESSVDSAIEFLATQQARDGSFKSHVVGQPAVTSLCVLAFLSRGHTPIDGPYAKQLSKAIDFIVSKQRADGLICSIDRNHPYYTVTGSYNHAINGLALCEVYGMSQGDQQKVVRKTIEMALEFSRKEQQKSKRWADDDGGWRYLNPAQAIDSDLSITSWHLMFYRSARNAEFDIYYNSGICPYAELLDLGLRGGQVVRSGSWFSLGDQQLGADEIKFDKKKPGGQETQVSGDQTTDSKSMQALWLRRVRTKPADFLKAKFAYQLETGEEEAE